MARRIVGSTNGWWAWLAPCFANGACLAHVDGTVDDARKIRVFFRETRGYPTNALRDVCRRASRSLLSDWPERLPHDPLQRMPLEEMNGLVYAGPWSSVVLAFGPPECYDTAMVSRQRSGSELLSVLRGHEAELRARGVEALTVFGSVARGDATEGSDVDLAVQPGASFSAGGFDHFGKMDALRDRLADLLGCTVDLVEVSAARPRLRQVIEQEGLRAF